LAVVSFSIGLSSCSKAIDQVASLVIQKKLESIETFHGSIAQRTLITPKDVSILSKVHFRKPHYFSSEVFAPPEYKGYKVIFNGKSFTTYWPWSKTAFRVIGLKPFTPEEKQTLLNNMRSEVDKNFLFELDGSGYIANRTTNRFTISPTESNPRKGGGQVQLDKERALPLEVHITDKEGFTLFSHSFRYITYNENIPEEKFHVALPEDTTIFTWDLRKKPLTHANATKITGEEIIKPVSLPDGLTLVGVYLTDVKPHMIMSDYSKRPIKLHIMQRSNIDWPNTANPMRMYIPLLTKQGFVRYYPQAGMKTMVWKKREYEFTLVTNLSVQKAIKVIDAMPE
jgi:outer membrane lipoprotein-sorting protein